MLSTRFPSAAPLHKKCYAVDIFRDKIYTAPPNYKTLIKHLRDACENIALRWDSIPAEVGMESEEF